MEITVNVPDRYFVHIDPVGMAEKLKLYAALLMFHSGRLSTGAACEFAGVDRYTFLAACARHNIPVISYDPEDLEKELQRLEELSC